MEVFMISIQLFAIGHDMYPAGAITYKAQQMNSMAVCRSTGDTLQNINIMVHGPNGDFRYKCIMRQGV